MAEEFQKDISISIDTLRIEPFLETRKVQTFDCGKKELNEFLNTEEVLRYEHENLGKTYLVYYRGEPCAYFTISSDSLRIEYMKNVKSFSKFSEMRLENIPATKIGRLAVDLKYQNLGIGRILITYIAGMAKETGIAVRLLIVQSKPESIEFYKKCGFQLTFETKREKGRYNRTMFFDLYKIE